MMNNPKKIVLLEISDFVNRQNTISGLGLPYIKSYLMSKNLGIDVQIIFDNFYERILKCQPDTIGISAISFYYENAVIFAKIIKKILPNVQIIIGGAHISLDPKSLDPIFDYGIIGEGEETMFELLSLMKTELSVKNKRLGKMQLKKINGICFFDNKKIVITKKRNPISNLDIVPNIPKFEKKYKKYILTSRGCPYNCTYCGSFMFWGSRKVRFHSAEYIFNDIKNLSSNFFNEIDIFDEGFAIDKSRIKKLIGLVDSIRRPWRIIKFNCYLKSEFVNNEICNLLKRLNVKTVHLSLNSGSDSLLKSLNCSSSALNQRAINCLRSWDFDIDTIFTFNNFQENEKDLLETEKFVKKNPFLRGMVRVNPPFPGTLLYKKLQNKHVKIDSSYLLRFKIDDLNHVFFDNLSRSSLEKSLEIARRIEGLFYKKKTSKISLSLKKITSIRKKILNMTKSYLYKSHSDFPKVVSIRTTNNCNLKCDICINADLRKDKSKDFSFSMAHQLLPDLKKYKPHIYLSGGEAILNSDFFKIVRLFKNAGLYVFTYTNGTLLDKYAVDLLSTGIDSISISLYSHIRAIHDATAGVAGSFDKTVVGIKKISSFEHKKTKLNIATVINDRNYRYLADMYDYVESLGTIDTWDLFNISFITPSVLKQHNKRKGVLSEMRDISGQIISREEYLSLDEIQTLINQIDIIKRKSKIFKTKLKLPDFNDFFYKKYYLGKKPLGNSKCIGVFEQLHLFNGYVNTWCGYRLSKIEDMTSLKKIWDSKKNIDFQKFVLKEKTFTNCFRCTKMIQKF